MERVYISTELIKSEFDLRGARKIYDNYEDYVWEIDDMDELNISLNGEDGSYYVFELDLYLELPESRKVFQNILNTYEISGYELAKRTGISQSTIADYVSGKVEADNISMKNIKLITDALEMSADGFLKTVEFYKKQA